jgi:hypothetical protein
MKTISRFLFYVGQAFGFSLGFKDPDFGGFISPFKVIGKGHAIGDGAGNEENPSYELLAFMTFRAAIPEAMEAIISRLNCLEIDQSVAKRGTIKSMPEHLDLRSVIHGIWFQLGVVPLERS